MPYLLNLVYGIALTLTLPWLVYQSIRTGKYREGLAARLLGRVPRRTSDRPCIWLHAVSVGEVNLLATLLDALRKQWPDWQCVVSTTTKTGYALACRKYPDLTVFYCPFDFTWAANAAVRRIRPACLLLAELELWPNLIRAAKRSGARVAVVNARLSERSFSGYRRVRWLLRPTLARLDLIAAQNREYADRFLALGASAGIVHVTGSLKYDGARTDRVNPATQRLAKLAGVESSDRVFLAGSTQEPEEALALAAFRNLCGQHPELRLVIVPRHPERFDDVAKLLTDSGQKWQRRTELDSRSPDPAARILLVDVVGELGAWWGTAHVGFVGGSLGNRGGQNMIEPAAYGVAVAFGPNTWNFRDVAAALIGARAAVVVHDGPELTAFVRRVLAVEEFGRGLGERAQLVVRTNLGATRRTVDLIEGALGASAPIMPAPHVAERSRAGSTARGF